MDTVAPHDWKPIGSRPSDLWVAGVVAVVNMRTNKAHFVATRNVGKRVRDQLYWLDHGTHHNYELQNDWDLSREHFEFFLAKRVSQPSMLNREKQMLIDQFTLNGQCYNRKRAYRETKERPKPSTIEEMLSDIARMITL